MGRAPAQSTDVAEALFCRVLHPGFTRALFGVDPAGEHWFEDDEAIGPAQDLAPIRGAIAQLVPSTDGTVA